MVARGHIKAKEGAEELKREQHNAEATAAWSQQHKGADGTLAAQRSCAHAVQCSSMTVSPGGQRDSACRELQWWKET